MENYLIQINLTDIKGDFLLQVDSFLRVIIDKFVKENKIETFYKIIFTDNWNVELTEFQKQNNLPIGYTDLEYGAALGKTLEITLENEKKHVIFLNKLMLLDITQLNERGLVSLFHELSHIYYFENIINNWKNPYVYKKDLVESGKNLMLTMWEEYFACRFMCPYLPTPFKGFLDDTIKCYKFIKVDIEKAKNEFCKDGDLIKLNNSIQPKITMLITYMSYLCGIVNGFNNTDDELFKQVCDTLMRDTDIIYIWQSMYNIYNRIFIKFPNISDIDTELTCLYNEMMKIYNHFGIYLTQTSDNKLYVQVL